MSLLAHGDHTSSSEVTHISQHGIWLLSSRGKELYMPYEKFPWFKNQPVQAIYNIEEPSPGHFYWPELDVDLTETIIENPSKFPLSAS